MNPLPLILVQSSTGPIFVIILLLLVAAAIGFITAWLYSKSIYSPVVKSLENEKKGLIKQIHGLKDDAVELNSKIDKLNDAVSKLEKKIAKKSSKAEKDK